MSSITLGIVEDNQKLGRTLAFFLEEEGIHVQGAYTSGEEALIALSESQPDILLVDIGLPGMDGVELIRRVKGKWPQIEIMVFTVFDERQRVFDSLKAGATGYILKDDPPAQMVSAILELYHGGAPMSKKIAKYVIEEFRKQSPQDKTDSSLLSTKEKEVLYGLAQGLTYLELAEQFSISPATVKTHIKKIYRKLQVNSKIEAINRAMEEGLL